MHSDFENGLPSYFTDMEHPRSIFEECVAASKLRRRLLVFHGVGGVGKSSLLRMFRLHCKSQKIPVGLASGDDAKSIIDLLTSWMDDLKNDGIKFPALGNTLDTYRTLQARVTDQAKKGQNRISEIASKAASKTAETAGGALLGAAIGSIVPGIGTAVGGALGGVVSGMGAEAVTDWLRGFLTKPDIDLLLDPTKRFITDFINDLKKASERQRVVLLFDTFEQMTAWEDRIADLIQKMDPNIVIVIAGRKLPGWDRVWPNWMMDAQVEELRPMTDSVMETLVQSYYATMQGGKPATKQVEDIIAFAHGLPMAVTSAVQLWVKYGVEDFQSVKAEIVANLVDRLMEGVKKEFIPALEAAAVVRWFDQPILRALMGKNDVRDVYNELRRFPFVRGRTEGLALHDSVREMIDENLRLHDSERHTMLHSQAASYFENLLNNGTGDPERYQLELLYHRIRADETTGVNLFQELAERLSLLRLTTQLKTLINDARTYSRPQSKTGTFVDFYMATLYRREHLYEDAIRIYQGLTNNASIDIKLKAYALCNLGEIYATSRFLEEKGGAERAISAIQRSLAFKLMDSRLIQNYFTLSRIAISMGRLDDAKEYLHRARTFFEQSRDDYGQIIVLIETKELARYGLWREYLSAHSTGLDFLSNLPGSFIYLRGKILRKWARVWAFTGRYAEGETYTRECINIEDQLRDEITPAYTMRDLAWLLGFQDKFVEAERYFEASLQKTEALGDNFQADRGRALGLWGVVLARQGRLSDAEHKLTESLAIHEKHSYFPGSVYEVHNWLGMLHEIKQDWQSAQGYYLKHLNSEWHGQLYFKCCAQTGLVRANYALNEFDVIPSLIIDIEQTALQYGYNDHLASVRLVQGHLELRAGHQDAAIASYKEALIYALRFNRFLLDEILIGRSQGTPFIPIIEECLQHSENGCNILSSLSDWWRMGLNEIGPRHIEGVSPIPEGISLLDAEDVARRRESGDGGSQRSVIDYITTSLP